MVPLGHPGPDPVEPRFPLKRGAQARVVDSLFAQQAAQPLEELLARSIRHAGAIRDPAQRVVVLPVAVPAALRHERRAVQEDPGVEHLVLVHAVTAGFEAAAPLEDLPPDDDAAGARAGRLLSEVLLEQPEDRVRGLGG